MSRCSLCKLPKATECTCPKLVKKTRKRKVAEVLTEPNFETPPASGPILGSSETQEAYAGSSCDEDNGLVLGNGPTNADCSDQEDFDVAPLQEVIAEQVPIEAFTGTAAIDFAIPDAEAPYLRSKSPGYHHRRNYPTFGRSNHGSGGPKGVPSGLKTPFDFFQLLWDTTICDTFIMSTNSYAKNINIAKWKDICNNEFYHFIAIVLFSGLSPIPEKRLTGTNET